MTRLLEQNYNILFVHPNPICQPTPCTPCTTSPTTSILPVIPPTLPKDSKILSTTIYFGLHTKQLIPYSALVYSASKFVFEVIDEWGQKTPDMEVHPFLVQRYDFLRYLRSYVSGYCGNLGHCLAYFSEISRKREKRKP